MTPGRLARGFGVVAAAALLCAGCATPAPTSEGSPAASASPTPIPTPSPTPEAAGTAATATVPSIDVHGEPGGATTATFAHPQPSGAPLTFLLVEDRGDWLHVLIPQRPNGSTGWVRADQVTTARLDYSLRVSTVHNTVSLYRNTDLITTMSAATGTGGTPTPLGNFYLTELLAPTNAGYGPFAFGLSAYSEVLSNFGGGPGQIGLHGTADAASLGTAASNGCIRLSNADITMLAGILPLGTPITIE
jgi:lipoprotein-anchoring transpeptidase ErfK/SrfK